MCVAGEKVLMFFFPPKNYEMRLGRRWWPSNLDKTGSLEGVIVQVLDNALLLIVEDKVIGNESLDDRFTRWISMMINFILSGLGVFTQARSDVATKSHNVKKEVTN